MPNQTNFKRPVAQFSMIVGLGLLLSACGGVELPNIDPNPQPTEQKGLIKGQITPFKAGQAQKVNPGAENKDQELPVTAIVDSAGKFDLNLPKYSAMTTTYSDRLVPARDIFGCAVEEIETFNAPDGMKIRLVPYVVSEKRDRYLASTKDTANEVAYKAWWFSNVGGTLRFKANCLLGKIDTTLALKRGWNVISTDTIYGGNNAGSSYAVTSQPTTYTPFKLSGASSLALQKLHPNVFFPWMNLPQYQNR